MKFKNTNTDGWGLVKIIVEIDDLRGSWQYNQGYIWLNGGETVILDVKYTSKFAHKLP